MKLRRRLPLLAGAFAAAVALGATMDVLMAGQDDGTLEPLAAAAPEGDGEPVRKPVKVKPPADGEPVKKPIKVGPDGKPIKVAPKPGADDHPFKNAPKDDDYEKAPVKKPVKQPAGDQPVKQPLKVGPDGQPVKVAPKPPPHDGPPVKVAPKPQPPAGGQPPRVLFSPGQKVDGAPAFGVVTKEIGPVTRVLRPEKLPDAGTVDKAAKAAGDSVRITVDPELKVVVLRGPADKVARAEEALSGRGLAGVAIELVRLHRSDAGKVARLVRQVIPEGVELLARPASSALVIEGRPELVRQAAELVRQVDGPADHTGPARVYAAGRVVGFHGEAPAPSVQWYADPAQPALKWSAEAPVPAIKWVEGHAVGRPAGDHVIPADVLRKLPPDVLSKIPADVLKRLPENVRIHIEAVRPGHRPPPDGKPVVRPFAPDGGRVEEHRFEIRLPEGHRPEGRRPEEHRIEIRRPEGAGHEERRIIVRPFAPEGGRPEGGRFEIRLPEGHRPDGERPRIEERRMEIRRPEEGRREEGRREEGRPGTRPFAPAEGRRPEGDRPPARPFAPGARGEFVPAPRHDAPELPADDQDAVEFEFVVSDEPADGEAEPADVVIEAEAEVDGAEVVRYLIIELDDGTFTLPLPPGVPFEIPAPAPK